MNRLSKIAIVIGMSAFLLSSVTAEAGIFRRCRQRRSACESCNPYQGAPYAQICRAAETMHHDGYCDYYCLLCPTFNPVLWQGAHNLPVGGCGVPASCVSRVLERGNGQSGDLQDMGYQRPGSAVDLLDWEETPDFTTTNPNHQVANVTKRYVKYEMEHKADAVFAQATSFDYSIDAGKTWTSFTVAFQIKKRAATHKPEELGKAKKGKEHSHRVKGLTVLTHKKTLDSP